MATEDIYMRLRIENGRMLDLGQMQERFHQLISQAHPDHIAAFFYWLDLKVAQFKVFGSCLSSSGNDVYSLSCKQESKVDSSIGDLSSSTPTNHHLRHHPPPTVSSANNGYHWTSSDRQVPLTSQHYDDVCTTNGTLPVGSVHELGLALSQSEDTNAKRMVKSLLRAMLVKPPSADVMSVLDVGNRSEFDSASDDAMEHLPGIGDVSRDEDSRSVNDSLMRDESATVESEPEQKSTLQQQIRTTASSTSEKTSRCPYCLKTFRYRSSYRRHVKIHEGIFSHECTICSRKFTRKEHFVRHKCDRRPNKPYNVTHEAYRRMSPAERLAITSKAQQGTYINCENKSVSEGPLALTSHPIGSEHTVPNFLLTGGSISSVNSSAAEQGIDTISSLFTMNGGATESKTTYSQNFRNHADAVIASHTESRRKSSTPRKVVAAEAEIEGCRFSLPDKLATCNSTPVPVMD